MPWGGEPASAEVTLPPLGVVWLTPDDVRGGPGGRLTPAWERPLGRDPAGRTARTTLPRVGAARGARWRSLVRRRADALAPGGEGVFEGRADAGPGDDYRYVLDGGDPLPDPCSRSQPEGVRGPSRVVDPAAFAWTTTAGAASTCASSSSTSCTSARSRPRAPSRRPPRACAELRDLGVTAIELMPVATFPGERNWGYDGLYTWAPAPGLRRPRRARGRSSTPPTRAGLGVILDVVYNHLGPGSRGARRVRPLLHRPLRHALGRRRSTSTTATAAACASGRSRTRCMWVRDYHVDGLRLDAVHAIYDDGAAPRAGRAGRPGAARPRRARRC